MLQRKETSGNETRNPVRFSASRAKVATFRAKEIAVTGGGSGLTPGKRDLYVYVLGLWLSEGNYPAGRGSNGKRLKRRFRRN